MRTYSARVLADSRHPLTDSRLTTLEVTFPRMVLAEFNTHRVFSRNSASSRAIPVEKMLEMVASDPFVPHRFPANGKGMQPGAYWDRGSPEYAVREDAWLEARDAAYNAALRLHKAGIHKQISNRVLEPFLWHTVVVSSTEWDNFLNLRTHAAAQDQIRLAAEQVAVALDGSTPRTLSATAWHLPFYDPEQDADLLGREELIPGALMRVPLVALACAGRCARVSYLTHDGKRDPNLDVELCLSLVKNGHMSPLEHVAYASVSMFTRSNFYAGWTQLRKLVPNESVFQATTRGAS